MIGCVAEPLIAPEELADVLGEVILLDVRWHWVGPTGASSSSPVTSRARPSSTS